MTRRFSLILCSFFLFICCGLVSLTQGSAKIALLQLLTDDAYILYAFRLPRMLTAFTSGGLLALSGCLIQLLLQNPLADPYLLGISGGAAFSTLLLMSFGISGPILLASAWFGAMFSFALIIVLTARYAFQSHYIILSGMAIACAYSALISFLLFLSTDPTLYNILFWLSGDISANHIPWVEMIILGSGLLFCIKLSSGFNILFRGEQEALALGLPLTFYRFIILALTALFTATAVILCGCISFIGIIVPQLMRKFFGFDQYIVLPMAVLWGGTLVMAADVLARTLIPSQQLPVGVFIALLGGPIFVLLIQKQFADKL